LSIGFDLFGNKRMKATIVMRCFGTVAVRSSQWNEQFLQTHYHFNAQVSVKN